MLPFIGPSTVNIYSFYYQFIIYPNINTLILVQKYSFSIQQAIAKPP
jgi:hypothetical protein